MTADGPRTVAPHSSRSAARLAAVQALYQIELSAISPSAVVAEFVEHRFDKADDGSNDDPADTGLFADLVRGASARRDEVDRLVAHALTDTWKVERLEKILRSILRLGAYELVARLDIPARVIITEYVDVANAFFDGSQPGLVNGVLDTLARLLRQGELADSAGSRVG